MTSHLVRIDTLRPIAIEDLLGATKFWLIQSCGPNVTVVCVTGAGGRLVGALPPDPGVVGRADTSEINEPAL